MKSHTFSFTAMACTNTLEFFWPGRNEAARLARKVIGEVKRIEAKYSRYLAASVTTGINRAAGGEPVQVDDETAGLLDYAGECFRQSDGLFDITSGVLRRCWDFRRAIVPSRESLDEVLPLIGWQRVHWHDRRVGLPMRGMELDFGGLGKEYAADRAAAVALELGAKHGFVNLGGDVRVMGPHPDGAPWLIGIAHPRRTEGMVAQVALKSGALATSGDYERYFELGGRRYCHILNPRTGFPVEGLQSASVCAPLCVVAGSLSTMAMLKEDTGCAFLDGQSFPSVRVDAEGRLSRRGVEIA